MEGGGGGSHCLSVTPNICFEILMSDLQIISRDPVKDVITG